MGVGDGGQLHSFAGVGFLDADEVADGVVFKLLPIALCVGGFDGGAGGVAGQGDAEKFARIRRNDRELVVLNRLLDGFEGKLTNSKYAKLTQCSPDTALRGIEALVEWRVLVRNPAGGRSTSYSLSPIEAE